MMRLSQLSVLLPLLLLAACDGEPSGPDGPSGGENRFRVFIGEDKEAFDQVGLQLDKTGTATITLRLSGSVDPVKNAIDDEYSLHLDILLDRQALLAATAPATLTVKGNAEFTAADEAGLQAVVEYEMDPTSSPIVKGLFFRRSCFCANDGAGRQSFNGTIEILSVSATEISGTFAIELSGDVPNYQAKLDATLMAEFNLAIP
jgi:hypothetical protein